MLDKPVDKITREDIEALVANEYREERRLDYKESLPGGTDKEKRESLADVSSFANAAGGLIIYGVSEKRDDKGQPTGIPGKALGLAGVNVDKVRLQLENSIRDGISPRIPGIRIEAVEGFPEGPVLLLSVPRGWAAPHMVTYKGVSRFYSRTSAGKHQLDVGEIRAAFELSAGLSIKLKDFRDERLGRITASDTPVELADSGKLVLHLLPLASFAGSVQVDLQSAHKAVGFYPIGVSFVPLPLKMKCWSVYLPSASIIVSPGRSARQMPASSAADAARCVAAKDGWAGVRRSRESRSAQRQGGMGISPDTDPPDSAGSGAGSPAAAVVPMGSGDSDILSGSLRALYHRRPLRRPGLLNTSL